MSEARVAPVSACLIHRGDVDATLRQLLTALYMAVEQTCVLDNMPSFVLGKYGSDTVVEWSTKCNDEDGDINFAVARNLSFDLARQPWLLWADSDDEIVGLENLPRVLSIGEMAKKTTGKEICFRFPYEYSYNTDGSVEYVFYRERLISNREAFRWVGACHETLNPIDASRVLIIDRDDIVWKHRRPAGSARKSLERNVRILKRHASMKDPRSLFYLANDYRGLGMFREAWETFIHYFECVDYVNYFTNEPEAIEAAIQLTGILTAMDRPEGALQWASRTITILERCPDAYFTLGDAFYTRAQKTGSRRDWEKCCHFYKLGLAIPERMRQRRMLHNPRAADAVDLRLHYALNQIGDVAGALQSARRALKVWPDDKHARQSEPVYAAHLKVESAVASSVEAVQQINSDALAATTLSAEQQFQSDVTAMDRTLKRAADILICKPAGKLKIDFVCGPGWEVWNPEIFRSRGMAGGAEGAVIEVSERLAKRGHNVVVHAGCGKDALYNGVAWINTPTWNFEYGVNDGPADVAVIWRNADFLKLPNFARKKALWLHDVYAMGSASPSRADRIVCMSTWHIEENMRVTGLPRERFAQTSGGVDFDRFDTARKRLGAGFWVSEGTAAAYNGDGRNPHRAVWISSLDRGLNEMLDMWPVIRSEVPDAELHIFYGYETWKKIAAQNNDTGMANRLRDLLQKLLAMKPYGVVYHDCVGHIELAAELLRSGVWLYPTSWNETFCQAAAEAQAAGLRMVTTPVAALNETVGRKGRLVLGDPRTAEFQERFIKLSIDAMLNTPNEARQALMQVARDTYSWDRAVDGWETLLREMTS